MVIYVQRFDQCTSHLDSYREMTQRLNEIFYKPNQKCVIAEAAAQCYVHKYNTEKALNSQ